MSSLIISDKISKSFFKKKPRQKLIKPYIVHCFSSNQALFYFEYVESIQPTLNLQSSASLVSGLNWKILNQQAAWRLDLFGAINT